MSSATPFPTSLGLRLLLKPALTDKLLDLLGTRGQALEALLHNTVVASIIRGGEWGGTIPSEITLELTAYMLPGYTPLDVIAELRQMVGDEVELKVVNTNFVEPGSPPEPDMGLFDLLGNILREADPEGMPVPLLVPSPSDGRTFSRLGIQTYGFMPMKGPAGFDFPSVAHAADERIPVEALDFGTSVIYKVLQQFGNK